MVASAMAGGGQAMKVLFHYAAGPDLAARLAAVPGLDITICPVDDTRSAGTLPAGDRRAVARAGAVHGGDDRGGAAG